ncbi:MAG: hypothetical protein KH615_07510, partial [Clostridiales bacterium]|nr:hypothetical protein [Clostridiales bacterium]
VCFDTLKIKIIWKGGYIRHPTIPWLEPAKETVGTKSDKRLQVTSHSPSQSQSTDPQLWGRFQWETTDTRGFVRNSFVWTYCYATVSPINTKILQNLDGTRDDNMLFSR